MCAEGLEKRMSPRIEEILVGDVGGTHARFAVAVAAGEGSWRITAKADLAEPFESFAEAFAAYLDRLGRSHLPETAVIAAAGPVLDGSVVLTNRRWRVCEQDLGRSGFTGALVINDFAALAFATDSLQPGDLLTIGPDLPGFGDGPVSIVGAGTGFGVSCRNARTRTGPMARTDLESDRTSRAALVVDPVAPPWAKLLDCALGTGRVALVALAAAAAGETSSGRVRESGLNRLAGGTGMIAGRQAVSIHRPPEAQRSCSELRDGIDRRREVHGRQG